MKQSLILIFVVISALGCQDVNIPEKPENLIAKDKMIDILKETYLINAARSVNNKAIISKGIKIDSMIYAKYQIDSLQFAKSNAYYASDINSYMIMIQKVESDLLSMREEMDSIIKLDRARRDSISERLKSANKVDSLN
ncbi:DUF4296 domain-containing protein [Aequorivita xiaoshiensis]|uniref:DUF4296 domain-containing protein n=1 Tax=Aequorivita xiaoshiensis TaxID=2874476 RepID=A0A9X1QXF8_9FLAO|nr:DUF4296 domain-containing protein [Aequorivita xiaoshiensis]MCG2429648.1 DUF4296 domain-containing protein [Aequorivita xiaoshiensis]